ncbi:MAG: amino acid--tRNA ligase-related protein [Desulfomonilia bacterium]|nr:amino acid--tRNA ligase-related protein [Desulfomonilia bacterium]
MGLISEDLFHFQAALEQAGTSLEEFIREQYVTKWLSDSLYSAMAIRTTMVGAIHAFLASEGLFNMEKVQMSPVTDPLGHDVEHTPTVHYKGMPYVTTHSMIYSKFLACFNPKIKGLFVDSPNIRLEIESPLREQRGKYLIDFSQIDVELRRNRGVDFEMYKHETTTVKEILKQDLERAIDFFERMIIAAVTAILETNEDDLKALGVALMEPKQPFPRLKMDEIKASYGRKEAEAKAGEELDSQFYWVLGLMRENYDLIYPYILPDGSKLPLTSFTSDMIYNYDICAKALIRKTSTWMPALEILSGAIREWLFEPIIERLIDNRIITERPVFVDGTLVNIQALEGYGPFLTAVAMKDESGKPYFPETFGGGIGVERTLFALLRGEKLHKIDDLTCFGKNPDSYPMFLF